jgi:hypothetical protein
MAKKVTGSVGEKNGQTTDVKKGGGIKNKTRKEQLLKAAKKRFEDSLENYLSKELDFKNLKTGKSKQAREDAKLRCKAAFFLVEKLKKQLQ